MSQQDIALRAHEHQEILDELVHLEYAPAALRDNEASIAALTERINVSAQQIAILHKKTKHEHKDFAKLQNSAGRRLFVRIKHGGKKEAVENKLKKEEREFLEALEEEQAAEAGMKALEVAREQLQAKNADLKQLANRWNQLRTRLNLLYESLFKGFTPQYPYEDEAEEAVRQAEDANTIAQSHVNRESQTIDYLSQARTCLQNCINLLYQAQGWNYNDMFGGGMFSDIFENNALIDAKAYAHRARTLVTEAWKKQPAVQRIDDINVAQLDFLVNIVFDNVFTDIMFAQRIQESLQSVTYGAQRVQADRDQAQARLAIANTQSLATSANLSRRRRELEEIRRTILQSINTGIPVPEEYGEPRSATKEQMEPLPVYERVEHAPKTPMTAATISSTTSTSRALSPPSQYSSSRPNSRPTTPQSRPITPGAVNPLNPYAGALLRRAAERDFDSDQGQPADRSVSQLIRERRANAGVSNIPPPPNYI